MSFVSKKREEDLSLKVEDKEKRLCRLKVGTINHFDKVTTEEFFMARHGQTDILSMTHQWNSNLFLPEIKTMNVTSS
jgi:hypothetical protein